MHKVVAVALIVCLVGGFKLGMYELRRYCLSEPAMAPPGPANGGGGSLGTRRAP